MHYFVVRYLFFQNHENNNRKSSAQVIINIQRKTGIAKSNLNSLVRVSEDKHFISTCANNQYHNIDSL